MNKLSEVELAVRLKRLEKKIEYFIIQGDLALLRGDEVQERMFLKASKRCLQLNIRLLSKLSQLHIKS